MRWNETKIFLIPHWDRCHEDAILLFGFNSIIYWGSIWPLAFRIPLWPFTFQHLSLFPLWWWETKTSVIFRICLLALVGHHIFWPHVPCKPWRLVLTWEHLHCKSLAIDHHGVHISSSSIFLVFSLSLWHLLLLLLCCPLLKIASWRHWVWPLLIIGYLAPFNIQQMRVTPNKLVRLIIWTHITEALINRKFI